MKKVLAMILTLTLIGAIVGCSSGGGNNDATTPAGGDSAAKPAETAEESKEPVKLRITWWGGQSRHDYTLKVIEMYEKENPHVKIEPEYSSWTDYWKKLAPQAAANQLPDIIQMDYAYLAQFGERNQLLDLTPYTKDGLLNVEDVSKNVLNAGNLNGKLYAMNLGVNAMGPSVDMEMIKQAGITDVKQDWTWDDLDSIAAKLKANGKMLGSFGLDHDGMFGYYLRTLGQTLYSKDGTALGYSDDQAFIDFYNRYLKWYENGYVPTWDKELQRKGTPEDDELSLGNAAVAFLWSNQYIALSDAAKRPLELRPMPGPNQNKGLYLKPSMFFSVAASSEQKEEAVKFIDYWTNNIEANKVIMGERGVPVSSKVKDALKPLLTDKEKAIFDYIDWVEKNSSPLDPPNPVGAPQVRQLLRDLTEKMLYKKISVEEAAAKFRKDANDILVSNK
ncbi:ABC transporter substrate-binding protein [Paenibacillus alkalitolerans]|uniref:ABC transporter substrate-binding protein n=1 Tax=Paenibacillus alkalitolerans TaxID=2799335 RepID=UPI0018F76B2C|nr:extracellular solute-binding protein [Paenibacillus alkalitolerans]